VLSLAVVPGGRSSAQAQSTILQGAAVGLMLGIALAFVKNMLRTSIRTPEELELATGLTVMGVTPKIRATTLRALIDNLVEKRNSALAEAIRNLRTAIQLSDVDARPQAVMVSSSLPGEGKSGTAISLAQSWASAGNKVLLLDCDLRRGTLGKQFKVAGKDGLIAVLSGSVPFEVAVHHDDRTGVDILIADSSKVTGVDVFGSKSFETFVKWAREIYDYIILDTPPVLAIPDARVIAQNVDTVLYIVQWNATSRRMVRSGMDYLHQVNVHVAGLALTQIDPKRMDRYGYYGYGYGHGYGRRKIDRYYAN